MERVYIREYIMKYKDLVYRLQKTLNGWAKGPGGAIQLYMEKLECF